MSRYDESLFRDVVDIVSDATGHDVQYGDLEGARLVEMKRVLEQIFDRIYAQGYDDGWDAGRAR